MAGIAIAFGEMFPSAWVFLSVRPLFLLPTLKKR
jgi:hypothetical protein